VITTFDLSHDLHQVDVALLVRCSKRDAAVRSQHHAKFFRSCPPNLPGIDGLNSRLRTGKRGSLTSDRPTALGSSRDHRDGPHLPTGRRSGMRALRGAYPKRAVVAAIVSLALASGACKKWA
jgi:hypothetical protein